MLAYTVHVYWESANNLESRKVFVLFTISFFPQSIEEEIEKKKKATITFHGRHERLLTYMGVALLHLLRNHKTGT
jgi:hypothetical protein